jgi:hypothetical protein
VRDGDVVERLHKIAKVDWKNSHPLDLSDEGLMADLDDREEGAAEKARAQRRRQEEAQRQEEVAPGRESVGFSSSRVIPHRYPHSHR